MIVSDSKATFWQKTTFLLIVLLVGLISRLPQLNSPHLILDGDEAIVGLMAKHITEGKPVTLYFYGQKYGFAYLEALAGAISFKLFGYGALQLKSAMLFLWLGALAFFYLAAARLTNPVRGLWLALLFALFPAWAVWSLKARGGYLTSFLFASVLVYLFINRKKDFKALSWLGIGILLGLVFYAQAFWLAGLFPLIAYHFYRYARKLNLVWLILGIAFVVGFFYTFGSATSNFWHPTVIGHNKHFFEPWQNLPDRFFMHLTGYFYLNFFYKPDTVTRILSIVWIVIFLIFTGVQIYRTWRFVSGKRSQKLADFALTETGEQNSHAFLLQKISTAPENKKSSYLSVLGKLGYTDIKALQNWFSGVNQKLSQVAAFNLFTFGTVPGHLLFLSTWFTIGYCLFFNEVYYGFRYLLPLSGFMLLWLGAEFDYLRTLKIVPKAFYMVLIPVLILAGAISMYNFRNYSLLKYTELGIPKTGSEEERLNTLFKFLKTNNVYHVYSTDQLLEWFIPFYSAETILPRALPPIDRYPEYPQKVNAAYKAGKPTAVIGYYPPDKRLDTLLVNTEKVQRIGHWYYVYLNPTFEELVKIGFYKIPGQPASPDFVEERLRNTKKILPAPTL